MGASHLSVRACEGRERQLPMCNREEAARALLVCLSQAMVNAQKRVCGEEAEVARSGYLEPSYVTSSFLRKGVT